MSLHVEKGPSGVTEIDLGSPDAGISSLNAREKGLLKHSPSAAHWHQVLLQLLSTVRVTSKDLKKKRDDWNGRIPYEVTFEFGWNRKRLPVDAWLVKVKFDFHLADRGATLIVDQTEHEVRSGPKVVDNLIYLGLASFDDHYNVCSVLSTIAVELEEKVRHCTRESHRVFELPSFQKSVHRWVRRTMKAEMRKALAPLLKRYPAEDLVNHLHSLIVEEVHED